MTTPFVLLFYHKHNNIQEVNLIKFAQKNKPPQCGLSYLFDFAVFIEDVSIFFNLTQFSRIVLI